MKIDSTIPPIVELDSEAHAAYIRFSDHPVAKTKPLVERECLATVDLDSSGAVIGIELVGVKEFRLESLLEMAGVSPLPPDLLQRARYVPTQRRTELFAV